MASIVTAKYVVIARAAELTGYTVRAIETKIDSGVWPEGVMWKRAPDGRRLVNMEEYQRWVEGGQASLPAKRQSRSLSRLKDGATALPFAWPG